MPVCAKCGLVGPTVEMRRLPLRLGERGELLERLYACKEKLTCKRRRASPEEERPDVVTRQGVNARHG